MTNRFSRGPRSGPPAATGCQIAGSVPNELAKPREHIPHDAK